MRKGKTAGIFMAVLALSAGMAFASGSKESAPAPAAASKAPKAAMLMSGPINDGGWNTSAYDGLVALKEMGFEIAYTENVKQAEQKNIMRDYAKKGYDIIFGHGFEYGETILDVASEFPKTKFYNIGGTIQAENVGSGVFALGELSYLTGTLAAKFTKSNKIGFVGAQEIPTIQTEVEVITSTAKAINPSASVTVAYTGSWTDVNKGKEAALAQIANGVDVIICIGDACDVGAIKAAEEKGVHVIGWSGDFNSLSPKVVLTSGVQSVPDMVKLQGKGILAGNWTAEGKVFGITDGCQFLGAWSPDVSEDLKAEIMAEFDKIKSGSLVKKVN